MYQYHDTKKEQIYVTYVLSGKIGKPSTYTHRQFLTFLLLSTHNKVYFLSQFSKFNQQFRKQNQNSVLIHNTCKFKKKKSGGKDLRIFSLIHILCGCSPLSLFSHMVTCLSFILTQRNISTHPYLCTRTGVLSQIRSITRIFHTAI